LSRGVMMQEIRHMKKLIIGTSLALATLAATPSFAATHHSRVQAQQSYAAANSYEDYNGEPNNGLTANGPAIYSGGVYAGWDPDPNIRLELSKGPILQ